MYPWYTYTRARARACVHLMTSSLLWLIRVRHDAHTHLNQTLMTRTCDTAHRELKSKIFGHIHLLAEILNYFVWRNQSNINQYVHMTYVHELLIIQETLTWVTDDAWFDDLPVHTTWHPYMSHSSYVHFNHFGYTLLGLRADGVRVSHYVSSLYSKCLMHIWPRLAQIWCMT